MGVILGAIVLLAGIPGYVVLQRSALRRLDGWLRIAAVLPLVVMVLLIGQAMVAYSQGSNLWPLLVILGAPAGAIYLGLLIAIDMVRRDFA